MGNNIVKVDIGHLKIQVCQYFIDISLYSLCEKTKGIEISLVKMRASLVTQMVKKLPAVRETWVPSLGWEDSLKEGMATTPEFLPGESPWTEEPGGLLGYIPWGLKESDKRYILFINCLSIGYFKHFMTGVAYVISKDCHCCLVDKSCLTFCYPWTALARLPCPPLSPQVYSNSCPLSR